MEPTALWIGIRVALFLALVLFFVFARFPEKKIFTAAFFASIVCCCILLPLLGLINPILGLTALIISPFFQGVFYALIYGLQESREAEPLTTSNVFKTISLPSLFVLLEMGVLMVLMLEGVICILMALPFVWIATILGVLAGFALLKMQKIKPSRNIFFSVAAVTILPMVLQPLENQFLVKSYSTHVTTQIVINASPLRVFELVQGFPKMPANQPVRHLPEMMFALGLPAPQQSTIDCHGPGCMRHCIFNQHTQFEEKVTVYNPGKELTFDVTSVVGPQSPITGVDIHVMPGGMYFDNHKGQFLLTEIAPGKTLVKGTTWYTVKSSLNWYAKPWADLLLHTIHTRVLEHIKAIAESKPNLAI